MHLVRGWHFLGRKENTIRILANNSEWNLNFDSFVLFKTFESIRICLSLELWFAFLLRKFYLQKLFKIQFVRGFTLLKFHRLYPFVKKIRCLKLTCREAILIWTSNDIQYPLILVRNLRLTEMIAAKLQVNINKQMCAVLLCFAWPLLYCVQFQSTFCTPDRTNSE